MELNKDNMKKIGYLIAFAVLLYLGVQNIDVVLGCAGFLWGLVLPFVVGCAIAFVLNVPMKFIEKLVFGRGKEKGSKAAKRLARPVSLLLSIAFVIVLILIVVLVVAPELGSTIVAVIKRIEVSIPKLQQWAEHTFKNNPQIVEWTQSLNFQPEKILNSAINVLKSGVDNFLSSTVSVTMGILSTAMNVGIGFVFACYVLLQKETLVLQTKKVLHAVFSQKKVERILYVCALANRTFSNFITGQCIEAVILGSMFFVSMTILGFPYAMLVGVLISFMALIPIVGGIIACWLSFLLILMVSPVRAVAFLVLFVTLQQIEGNLIYPHVVGGSVGLPSIWVLAAVTVGGSLMGIVGMLVFIPLVSVLYTLFKEWVNERLEKKKETVMEGTEI